MASAKKPVRVLATGLDVRSAIKIIPSFTEEELSSALNASIEEMKQAPDLYIDICWLSLDDEKPADRLAKFLQEEEPFDAVLIGWGVRGIPEVSWLFEDCVEAVRSSVPLTTRFLFSTIASDHLVTIYRRFPHIKPASTTA